MFSIKNTAIVTAVALLLIVALITFLVWRNSVPSAAPILNEAGEEVEDTPLEASGETIGYLFTCSNNETFTTSYDFGSNALTLTLAEGESYELPQTPTDAGARYASRDGRVVFTEDGGQAQVQLNGRTVRDGCEASALDE